MAYDQDYRQLATGAERPSITTNATDARRPADIYPDIWTQAVIAIGRAIQASIEQERQECLAIVLDYGRWEREPDPNNPSTVDVAIDFIAEAIRQRSL